MSLQNKVGDKEMDRRGRRLKEGEQVREEKETRRQRIKREEGKTRKASTKKKTQTKVNKLGPMEKRDERRDEQ